MASEWFEHSKGQWTEDYRTRTINAMTEYLFPHLGRKGITTIEAPELLKILQKIKSQGELETTHRLKGYASRVF